jgi:hypothetical protein
MKHGAVAILDALGFKGIWKRERSESILAKLRRLRDVVVEDITRAQQTSPAMLGVEIITRQAAFLSDSLVIGVSVEAGGMGALGPIPPVVTGFPGLLRQDHSLRDLLLTLVRLLDMAATDSPHLAYRGTIACGEFEFDDVFVLGPAIDEAAELASQADGAFVWLTPSALEVQGPLEEFNPYIPYFESLAPKYAVPMKAGTSVNTRALNPLAEREPEAREAILEALLGTFVGANKEIQRKRQNTETFLRTFLQEPSARTIFRQLMRPPPSWKRP